MDYISFLQLYFAKELEVNPNIWNTLSTIISKPEFLGDVLIKMALDKGWKRGDNPFFLNKEFDILSFEVSGGELSFYYQKFVDEVRFDPSYGVLPSLWNYKWGKFFFQNQLVTFQEWIESYKAIL